MSRVFVALPVPVPRCFSYCTVDGAPALPGCRVRVPFGRRELIGVVTAADQEPTGDRPYRDVTAVLDTEPLIDARLRELCDWVAQYYCHPLGGVYAAALPATLRRGEPAVVRRAQRWCTSPAGRDAAADLPERATVLRELLGALTEAALTRDELLQQLPKAAAAWRRAVREAWIEPCRAPGLASPHAAAIARPLTGEQAAVFAQWQAQGGLFDVSLIEGVTGSGKTELYLAATAEVLARGQQVLVLVPEIGLTPQLLARFSARFPGAIEAYHSGLGERARGDVWLRARSGEVRVLIGTRSAVFVPLPAPGLIVIDEEHDPSFKQQDGLSYSARDVAIVRARAAGARVMLGSATPSLETLHNAQAGRYRHLRLASRVAAESSPPPLSIVDVRGSRLQHGLSPTLLHAMRSHLRDGGQVLLFVNRRGYAPALLCHDCGWVAPCRNCDARMTVHRPGRLLCHHCGAQQRLPPACGACHSSKLLPVGHGTERIEEGLAELFPQYRSERFDSERLRRAGELERLLADTRTGAVHILVGTQIIAKGHDFAGITLVGIVSVDQALYSADFRAIERIGQLLVQVAGRAGRAARTGEVLLQTHEPDHPLLRKLVDEGYGPFARALLAERRAMQLPPYAYLALLRAEAASAEAAMAFLGAAAAALDSTRIEALGPVPAPMERRAGRYRAQLLLRAARRSELHAGLRDWSERIGELPQATRVRWSLDVDPGDLF